MPAELEPSEHNGSVKRLARGELEARVMDVLWDADQPMTPAEVHDAVSTRRRPLAYTTVMTILVRLYEKGRLRRRARGRAFAYVPRYSRDEWAALRMAEVLEAAGDQRAALTHFVATMGDRETAELRRLLGGRRDS